MSKLFDELDVFRHVPDVFKHVRSALSLEPTEELDFDDLLVFKSSVRWPESWELELALRSLGCWLRFEPGTPRPFEAVVEADPFEDLEVLASNRKLSPLPFVPNEFRLLASSSMWGTVSHDNNAASSSSWKKRTNV